MSSDADRDAMALNDAQRAADRAREALDAFGTAVDRHAALLARARLALDEGRPIEARRRLHAYASEMQALEAGRSRDLFKQGPFLVSNQFLRCLLVPLLVAHLSVRGRQVERLAFDLEIGNPDDEPYLAELVQVVAFLRVGKLPAAVLRGKSLQPFLRVGKLNS
jgi:hypothetical protein